MTKTNPPKYLRAILTPKQYAYYTEYVYGTDRLADIAIRYDVDITTVCRVIKTARKRIINYCESNLL